MAGKKGDQLPSLAFASIDPANDLVTLFDASATGTPPDDYDKKIAAVEFLKRMLGSVDIDYLTTITMTAADADNDSMLVFDADGPGFKRLLVAQIKNTLLRGFIGSAAAAPTSGTYSTGDLVKNNAPAAGAPLGWWCTAGGTPGSWVPLSPALEDEGEY